MTWVSAKVLCQVGSAAGDPCAREASAEIMGVPLCEAHTREQEAYFALGELAEACGMVSDWERQARCRGNGALLKALGAVRLDLDERMARQREFARARGVRSW